MGASGRVDRGEPARVGGVLSACAGEESLLQGARQRPWCSCANGAPVDFDYRRDFGFDQATIAHQENILA